jgi:flagellar assembly protein FliH
MSSRLLPPEASLPAEQIPWRRVNHHAAGNPQRAEEPEPQEAAALVAEARRELEAACEARVKEARAAGRKEGEAAARDQYAADLQALVDRVARSLEEIAGLRRRLRHEAETDLVRLALAIARRVLYRELAVDPDAMRGVVIAATEKLQAQEISRVRVHPELAPMLAAALERIGSATKPEIVADAARERGALVFETTRGALDASIETQLREIESGLTDQLRRSA